MLRSILATLLLFAVTLPAHAERIDIDDPSVLGPALVSMDIGDAIYDQGLITEVRYAAGLYSYVYGIQSFPYWPVSDDSSHLVSFDIQGHPLGGTWGAIRHTDPAWAHYFASSDPHSFRTTPVASMTAVSDGFQVVPIITGEGQLTVVYMQSPLPPSRDGMLTYRGEGTLCRYGDSGYVCKLVSNSFQAEGFLAPVPEPASIVLLGAGLAAFAAKRRATGHRVNGREARSQN